MDGIFLNAVEFFPSDVALELTKIGKVLVMDDGTRRFVQRVDGSGNPIFKRAWTITWRSIAEADRAAIEAIHALGTTFTFIDQNGASYTAQCEDGAYSDSVSDIEPDNTLFYDVTLKVFQP